MTSTAGKKKCSAKAVAEVIRGQKTPRNRECIIDGAGCQ
jgi:hypothetical protein